MAQWESARLEAEARLSRESLLSNPPPPPLGRNNDSDYFLRLWNSEVGESFRNKDRNLHVKAQFLRHLHQQNVAQFQALLQWRHAPR
ncbi:Transcription factor MYB41 [Vitis vinifera]|uniref:Transcription factor MYB41 n=1 Tax=Vitis vinifera TaxID=29760 RepID=A0A438H9Y8_VITVI|nr:Transcription factor MYB41 [Vitis vinifera]